MALTSEKKGGILAPVPPAAPADTGSPEVQFRRCCPSRINGPSAEHFTAHTRGSPLGAGPRQDCEPAAGKPSLYRWMKRGG